MSIVVSFNSSFYLSLLLFCLSLFPAFHFIPCRPFFYPSSLSSLNAALTQQAINRCHRVGQTREVSVYHLVMKDSIEEKIMEMTRAKLDTTTTKEDSEVGAVTKSRRAGAKLGAHTEDRYAMSKEELTKMFA